MGYIALIAFALMLSLFFNGILIVKNHVLSSKIEELEKTKENKNEK